MAASLAPESRVRRWVVASAVALIVRGMDSSSSSSSEAPSLHSPIALHCIALGPAMLCHAVPCRGPRETKGCRCLFFFFILSFPAQHAHVPRQIASIRIRYSESALCTPYVLETFFVHDQCDGARVWDSCVRSRIGVVGQHIFSRNK